jgi:hypothetical protein
VFPREQSLSQGIRTSPKIYTNREVFTTKRQNHPSHRREKEGKERLSGTSVDLANSREAIARVELVLTIADHEPGVTLDLVGAVEVGHGVLEEASSLLLGSRAGVKTELGDPDLLSGERSSLLNLSLEAVDGLLVVDVVEVDVGCVDDSVGAAVVEAAEPVESKVSMYKVSVCLTCGSYMS